MRMWNALTARARRVLSIVLVLFAVITGATMFREATAAMAVYDASNLAKNAETAATTVKLLSNAADQLQEIQSLYAAFGEKGAFKSAKDLGGILRRSGADDVISKELGVSLDLSVLRDLERLAGGAKRVDSVRDGVNYVRRVLGAAEKLGKMSPQEEEAFSLEREKFRIDSAGQALGTAFYHGQDIPEAGKRLAEIRTEAERASNLQQRLSVNTAAVLFLGEELVMHRNLMAATLQMQASERYTAQPTSRNVQAPPAITDSGGTQVFQ